MPKITGTFDAVENSAPLTVNAEKFTLSLKFAGTATVRLMRRHAGGGTDDNWNLVQEYTADYEGNGEEPATGMEYRLECTAHTDDVDYMLGTKD